MTSCKLMITKRSQLRCGSPAELGLSFGEKLVGIRLAAVSIVFTTSLIPIDSVGMGGDE